MSKPFAGTCWSCGYEPDSHMAIGSDKPLVPEAGNISVCIACGEISVFMEVFGKLSLRSPTLAEREEILREPKIVAAMLAHRVARATDTSWPKGRREQ